MDKERYIYVYINIWTIIKMLMMFDQNKIYHIPARLSYIYNSLFESSCVWWMEINNSYVHICIRLFVMQIHYAVWVILMVGERDIANYG